MTGCLVDFGGKVSLRSGIFPNRSPGFLWLANDMFCHVIDTTRNFVILNIWF